MKFDKILLAFDSYKGCLSSTEVAKAVEKAILSVNTSCNVHSLAIADGGEGTLDAVLENIGGHKVGAVVSDPLGRPVPAEFGIAGKLAVIESAAACGLTLLSPEERDPMLTTTRGLGELLLAALDQGCEEFIVGLGGSATNDGGRGMAEVPGLRERIHGKKITVACDVDNPFIGPKGASRVFAPQKGADAEMVEELERRLCAYAAEIREETGVDVRDIPGAGAAGGLGGAFVAFFGAELRSGIDIILDSVNFDALLDGVDLIMTGEGRSDSQTLMGKCPYGILKRAVLRNVPVALMSGAMSDIPALSGAGFSYFLPVTPEGMPLAEAMRPEVAQDNITGTIISFFEK